MLLKCNAWQCAGSTTRIFQSYQYNIVEIALNGKRQFLTLSTQMRDSFITLENQNIKLTFNGTAIPEQPRQSKRYAYNSVDSRTTLNNIGEGE